jgi:hypothetical protein
MNHAPIVVAGIPIPSDAPAAASLAAGAASAGSAGRRDLTR